MKVKRQVGAEVEITPEMISAGADRLADIGDASVAYLAF
jgi:hypothetical protein